MVLSALVIGILNSSLFAQAQESDQEQVPQPTVLEHHNYNTQTSNEFQNQYWSISMAEGDTMLNLIADNATRKNSQGEWLPPVVDYQRNTQYFVGGVNYIASLDHQ